MKQLLGIASLMLLASGCMSPIKTEPVSRYQINAVTSGAVRRVASPYTLLVSRPQAGPGFETDSMIYLKKRFQLQSFATHQWVMPPSTMVQTCLIQSLQASGIFHAVVGSGFTGESDYRLDSNLVNLQHDFLQSQSVVRLSLQVSLVDNKARKIKSTQMFMAQVPAASNTPYSGVEATNAAMQELEARIIPWVNKQIK